MTKVQRIDPDVLIAMFAIYDVLLRYKDSDGREISIGENEDGSIYSEPESEVEMTHGPVSSMLWGNLSCKPESWKIYERSQLPIQSLLHILRKANFEVDCFINISEYEKLLSIDHLQESLEDGHGVDLQKDIGLQTHVFRYFDGLSKTSILSFQYFPP